MAKKSEMPNLANATPEFLADQIGALAQTRKENEKLEKFYKAALQARANKLGLEFVQGERFECSITKSTRTSLDTKQVKEEMGEDWFLDRCRQTNVTTIKSGLLGTLSAQEEEDIAEDE